MPKRVKSCLILFMVAGFYYFVYDCFSDYVMFSGLPFEYHFSLNILNTLIIVLLISMLFIFPHVLKIKMTFYHIFLQSIFDQNTSFYKIAKKGYFLIILAFALSVGVSATMVIFLALLSTHYVEYFLLSIFSIFLIHLDGKVLNVRIPLFKSEIADIAREYCLVFLFISFYAGLLIAYTYFFPPEPVASVSTILALSNEAIDEQNIAWKEMRVLLKHAYVVSNFPRFMLNIEGGLWLYIFYNFVASAFTYVLGFLLFAKTFSQCIFTWSAKHENAIE